jgi:hypothetical protein
VDHSEETDYDLTGFSGRMAKAEEYAQEGKRTAGAFVLSGVKLRLAEDKHRERLFMDLKTAELWGGETNLEGEARDEAKALTLVRNVEASAAQDPRLLADAQVARAVIAIGAENVAAMESAFLAAMTQYERAGAYVRSIDAARFALRIFYRRQDNQRALRFARMGYQTALDLDKPGALCLVSLDCAMLSFRSGAAAQAGEYLNDAYAAALKTNNLRFINAVISQAVLEFAGSGDFKQALHWGEAMRQQGEFPTQRLSGLGQYEYARTLCLYALSLLAVEPESPRLKPALEEALAAASAAIKDETLGAEEQNDLKALSEKVNSGLLKSGGD